MSVTTTVLFGTPQREIASMVAQRMAISTSTSIVTGFATPGGLEAIADPVKARPSSVYAIVIGAATYPGFETLDELNAAGVPLDRLYVHLGHTRPSGFKKNPTVRFHPMLHSKIYFMELPQGNACAFIGSHNLTSFALNGRNGEAGILLEGSSTAPEFQHIRDHIQEARRQAVIYSPDMKESLAWWTREFIDGMKAEVRLPIEWITIRTILIFAKAGKADRLKTGDALYFEIPVGIEQIDSLSTETHLFLFENPPSDPWEALRRAPSADAKYTCKTLGAENKQGNREVAADWRLEGSSPPELKRVPSKVVRPTPPASMQQARAEVLSPDVKPYDYLFDREKKQWDPVYSQTIEKRHPERYKKGGDSDDQHPEKPWLLVTGLKPRDHVAPDRDAAALQLAAPKSGRLVLVSLRRREKKDKGATEETS